MCSNPSQGCQNVTFWLKIHNSVPKCHILAKFHHLFGRGPNKWVDPYPMGGGPYTPWEGVQYTPRPNELFGPGPNTRGVSKCSKMAVFTPFLTPKCTHFWSFLDPISGPGVLFSGMPCISGVLPQTENRPQNRAFGPPKSGQKSRIFVIFSENPKRIPI